MRPSARLTSKRTTTPLQGSTPPSAIVPIPNRVCNRFLSCTLFRRHTMATSSPSLATYHPLQRLPSPSRGVSAVIHLMGIVSFTLSYKYLIDFPTHINDSYGWHWQHLTILGLTVAYATFVVGLLADLTLSPKLFLIKNTLSLCSAPLEVLISILYWGLCAIDRGLVVPPEIHLAPLADV